MLSSSHVRLDGKVSRVTPVKYTPAGTPIMELVVASKQSHLDRESVGYFVVAVSGDLAENVGPSFKIGQKIFVEGTLFSRSFKDRRGNKVNETKIVADSIRGESNG